MLLESTVIFCRRPLRNAFTPASKVAALMRSFSASRSYANSWKYEMPPIIAAPATMWSQSIASSLRSLASLASPSTSRYRGSSSKVRDTRPYLLKLSTPTTSRSEEHTSELQSHHDLVCRLLLEKKKKNNKTDTLNKLKKTTKVVYTLH